MTFTFNHYNFNVFDIEKSVKFYEEAFGLRVVKEKTAPDGSFRLIFMGDGETSFRLELTSLEGRTKPYDLGEGEFHLAFYVDDLEAAHEKHKEMGIICYENPVMGVYFVEDPDGYWIEVVKKH